MLTRSKQYLIKVNYENTIILHVNEVQNRTTKLLKNIYWNLYNVLISL